MTGRAPRLSVRVCPSVCVCIDTCLYMEYIGWRGVGVRACGRAFHINVNKVNPCLNPFSPPAPGTAARIMMMIISLFNAIQIISHLNGESSPNPELSQGFGCPNLSNIHSHTQPLWIHHDVTCKIEMLTLAMWMLSLFG